MKKNYYKRILIVLLLVFNYSALKAQDVLIIYDDTPTNTNTVSLANALTASGMQVSFSQVSESQWNNTNPSLADVDAVIHLNGTTFGSEMPVAGQLALSNYVENENGLYVGFEWNAFQDGQGQMQSMIDLILFERTGGQEGVFTYDVVPAQAGNPVMNGVAPSFDINAGVNIGNIRTFGSNPSTVIMTNGTDDAVAVRDFGTGHVLGFNNAGNYNNYPVLSNTEIQKIIINFLNFYSLNGVEVITQDIVVELDANGNATITPQDIDNGSSAPGGIADLSLDISTFDCSNIGENIVTLTVTEDSSSLVLLENGSFESGDFTNWTAVDNPNPYLAWNVGLERTDAFFGVKSPTDGDNFASNGFDGNVGEAILFTDITIPSDGLPISLTWDENIDYDMSFGATQERIYEVQVRDLSGNVLETLHSVTADPNTSDYDNTWVSLSADLSAYAGQTVRLAYWQSISENFTGPGSFALDNVKLSLLSNRSNSGIATVTVVDNLLPTALTQDLTVELDANGEATITAAEVDNGSADNCGVDTLALDATSFDCSNLGENTVTLTVTDASGNEASATATVTVVDLLSPAVVTQDLTVELDANGEATITAAEVDNGSADNCGVDTLALDVTSFDCSNLGENTVTLTVTDASGNEASATATVTVVDLLLPTALTQDLTVELDANGEATITAAEVDNGSADNCGVDTLALDVTSFDCSNLGENTVTLTVTDASGNEASATAVITVVDLLLPTALTQDLTVELDANGEATITAAEVDNGSADNCGVDTLALDVTSFDCSNLGENTVTLTVTDASGNEASATAVITVVDNLSPAVVTQDLTVELDANGEATITAAEVDNGSADNCGVDTLALDVTSFDCSNLGENTVTLTVTDASGNEASASAVITVVDLLLPTALTQDLTVELDANGEATITATQVDNGSADNCGVDTLALDVTSFDCSNLGENTVTLTVTDASGNEASATATVTVIDVSGPVLITQDITVNLDENGTVTILPIDVLSSVEDNCTASQDITLSLDQDTFTAVGVYVVNLTSTDASGNNVTVEAEVTVDDTLSIDDVNSNAVVKLYPNPTSGDLFFEVSNIQVSTISIYDMNGRLVKTSKNLSLNVSDLSSGVYFAKVDSQNGKTFKVLRFIKK